MNENLEKLAKSPQDAGLFWKKVLGMASKKMHDATAAIKLVDPKEASVDVHHDPARVARIFRDQYENIGSEDPPKTNASNMTERERYKAEMQKIAATWMSTKRPVSTKR